MAIKNSFSEMKLTGLLLSTAFHPLDPTYLNQVCYFLGFSKMAIRFCTYINIQGLTEMYALLKKSGSLGLDRSLHLINWTEYQTYGKSQVPFHGLKKYHIEEILHGLGSKRLICHCVDMIHTAIGVQ